MEWLMEQGHPMRASVCMEAAAEEQFEADTVARRERGRARTSSGAFR